jgi:two-component system, sensor histidine kinase LadS
LALKSIPFHKMKKRIFLWLYFLLHAVPSWCQDTLVYQGQDTDITKIGRFLSFYEDKSHSLTFEAVQQIPDSLFHQIDSDELNLGVSKSKIWFKINIQNQTEEPLYIINEVPIFRWELWTFSENGELLHQKTGIMESYTSRFFRVTDLNFSIGKHPKTLIMSFEVIRASLPLSKFLPSGPWCLGYIKKIFLRAYFWAGCYWFFSITSSFLFN